MPSTKKANDPLTQVLGQSEHVEVLVDECVEQIGVANGDLQVELARPAPPAGVQQALHHTVAVEDKLEVVSGELAAVTAGLEREVRHRVETEAQLTEVAVQSAHRLAAIVESSDDAIIGKDLCSVVTSWNRGAERIFGYSSAEMVGRSIMLLIPEDRRHEEGMILAAIQRGDSVEHFETQRLTRAGRRIHVSETASPIRDAQGVVIGVSKIARDMTAMVAETIHERELTRAELNQSLERVEAERLVGLHDALTGLPNRNLFKDRLEHGLAQARRHGWMLAVMFIDLDGFKQVNDTQGHDVGDAVLVTIAGRLKASTRSDDTISRFGGDEFVYLAMEVRDEATAGKIAETLLHVTCEPCDVRMVRGLQVLPIVHASIGIALFPRDGDPPEALIANADQAMYVAKRTRTGYAFLPVKG